jgi:hypothetical protein
MVEVMDREKKYLLSEMVQVKGLMPLLMKPRNKQKWSPEDRQEVIIQLRRLSRISPYLAVMVLPGSFIMLPALAWWLDRRRLNKLRKDLPPGAPAAPAAEAQPPQKS